MHHLPSSTIKLITSTQVITSTHSVVKELLENSLDAGANSIEIKLENYGLDKIELRDNGCGVQREDVTYMAQPHYTSKLTCTEDLEQLETYGFRGEALGSLCTVGEVKITTKTKSEDVSMEYTLDHKGQILQSKPSHLGQGTTVTVCNLFKNLPVRKQYHTNTKRKKETLKQVEDLVVSYGIIRPDVRIILKHNKDIVWQKTSVSSNRNVLHSVLGSAVINQLEYIHRQFTDPQFEVECYLPKRDSNAAETGRTNTEKTFIYVNKRPVTLKHMEKILKQHFSSSHSLDTARYPVGFVSITTDSKDIDVNVDPNKTQVMLHNKEELYLKIEEIMTELYKNDPHINNNDDTNKQDDTSSEKTTPLPQVEVSYEEFQKTQTNVDVGDTLRMDSSCQRVKNSTESHNVNETMNTIDGTCESIKLVNDTNYSGDSDSLTTPRRMSEDLNTQSLTVDNHATMTTDGNSVTMTTDGNCENIKGNSNNTESASFHDVSMDDIFEDDVSDLLLKEVNLVEEVTVANSIAVETCEKLENKASTEKPSLTRPPGSLEMPVMSSTLLGSGNNGDDVQRTKLSFDLSGDLDDLLGMDIDTPVKATVPSDCSKEMTSSDWSTGTSVVNNQGQEMAGSDWSKGTSVVNNQGQVIQPVQVLVPKSSSLSLAQPKSVSTPQRPGTSYVDCGKSYYEMNNTMKNKDHVLESPGQATLYDYMGDSSVKKPTSSFIYFSKEIRAQVVKENPLCKFEDISKILGQRWKSLTEAERDKYDQLKTRDVERYREQKLWNTSSSAEKSVKKRRKIESGDSSVMQKYIADASKKSVTNRNRSPKKSPTIKSVTVHFSVSGLKKQFESQPMINSQQWNTSIENKKLHLIGKLKLQMLWVGCQEHKLVLFQPIRAKELLIYQGLLETHGVPLEPIENPMELKQSALRSVDYWKTLLAMKKTPPVLPDPYSYFTDDRLVKNGFKIRQIDDGNNPDNPKIEIVGRTNCMSFYGIQDLNEILDLVTQHGLHAPLHSCRPVNIQHYLQAEAVRMCRQLPPTCTHRDCIDILDSLDETKSRYNWKNDCCFHEKPYLLTVYDMNELPCSQLSQTQQTQCTSN